jgi:hypothetical protein
MRSKWIWYVEFSGEHVEWRLPTPEYLLFWE